MTHQRALTVSLVGWIVFAGIALIAALCLPVGYPAVALAAPVQLTTATPTIIPAVELRIEPASYTTFLDDIFELTIVVHAGARRSGHD